VLVQTAAFLLVLLLGPRTGLAGWLRRRGVAAAGS